MCFSSGITSVLKGKSDELNHVYVGLFFLSTDTAVQTERVRICSLVAGELWAMQLSASLTRLGLVSLGFFYRSPPLLFPYALFHNVGTIHFI